MPVSVPPLPFAPALNPARRPSVDTYRPLHDACFACVDILTRLWDSYRAADLPPAADIVYGEPFDVNQFPTFAVIPIDGTFEQPACTHFRSVDDITIRVYWRQIENAGDRTVFPNLVRAIDALTLMFAQNPTLKDSDGRHRVTRVVPARRSIGVLVESSRSGQEIYKRIGELSLSVHGHAWNPDG